MPKKIRDNEYSIEHSIQRFKERYGQDITPAQYHALSKMVREMIAANQNVVGEEIVSRKPLIKQWVLKFEWGGRTIMPVFESARDAITTFLPN